MAGRLDRIENVLGACLGSEVLVRCPELVYNVNAQLVRFMRTGDTLSVLWRKVDSLLFNSIYSATERSMVVSLGDGSRRRMTSDTIRDLADRVLALAYADMPVSPALQDALFDVSREGSFAAMRELLARFPLDEFDRGWLTQVLEENGQLQ